MRDCLNVRRYSGIELFLWIPSLQNDKTKTLMIRILKSNAIAGADSHERGIGKESATGFGVRFISETGEKQNGNKPGILFLVRV